MLLLIAKSNIVVNANVNHLMSLCSIERSEALSENIS